jgi:L-threonylcarbamoyladenylate synthase
MVGEPNEMARALAELEAGGVVAAATESLFGLCADAACTEAITRLCLLKPRGDKGVPLLLPDRGAWLEWVAEIPELAQRLAAAFWPGPLTIALRARPEVDPRLLEQGTIAVRLAAPCPASELARALGRTLTATSANPTGAAPTPLASGVRAHFAGAVATGRLLVVGPDAPGGPPSTVVTVRASELEMVRVGAIGRAEVERVAKGR